MNCISLPRTCRKWPLCAWRSALLCTARDKRPAGRAGGLWTCRNVWLVAWTCGCLHVTQLLTSSLSAQFFLRWHCVCVFVLCVLGIEGVREGGREGECEREGERECEREGEMECESEGEREWEKERERDRDSILTFLPKLERLRGREGAGAGGGGGGHFILFYFLSFPPKLEREINFHLFYRNQRGQRERTQNLIAREF